MWQVEAWYIDCKFLLQVGWKYWPSIANGDFGSGWRFSFFRSNYDSTQLFREITNSTKTFVEVDYEDITYLWLIFAKVPYKAHAWPNPSSKSRFAEFVAKMPIILSTKSSFGAILHTFATKTATGTSCLSHKSGFKARRSELWSLSVKSVFHREESDSAKKEIEMETNGTENEELCKEVLLHSKITDCLIVKSEQRNDNLYLVISGIAKP